MSDNSTKINAVYQINSIQTNIYLDFNETNGSWF